MMELCLHKKATSKLNISVVDHFFKSKDELIWNCVRKESNSPFRSCNNRVTYLLQKDDKILTKWKLHTIYVHRVQNTGKPVSYP